MKKILQKVDLYQFINNTLLVVDKNKLFTINSSMEINELKLPVKIENLKLSIVNDGAKLIVWGDDGIGNTFYILENGSWERMWFSSTKKKVDCVISDNKNNMFVKLKDENGLLYQAIVNKKIYTWNPPRNTEATIKLLDSDTKTLLEIQQSDSLPLQINKELTQTCKINFVFHSEFKGIKNDTLEFTHNIQSATVEGNFEPITLKASQFKMLLDGEKVLQDFGEIKQQIVSYEQYRIDRPQPLMMPKGIPEGDVPFFDDVVGERFVTHLNNEDIVKLDPKAIS